MPRSVPAVVATALVALALTAGFAPEAAAQDEAALKERFEGTLVRVKIDMPAHQSGVDVWPLAHPQLNWEELGKRLKKNGIALRGGETALVTKVKVKKNLIEFQLAGGGYGTLGDDIADVHYSSAPKTQREKNLEQDLKRENDPAKRRQIEEELDALKRERQREDERNRAAAADAEAAQREDLRSRAAGSGSRFNLRYDPVVPASALEPEGITTALRQFVEFDVGDFEVDHEPPIAATGIAALRKGMTRAEAEVALGAPTKTETGKEGALAVERVTFTSAEQAVDALFVEGILVRYTVRSR